MLTDNRKQSFYLVESFSKLLLRLGVVAQACDPSTHGLRWED